MRDDFAAEMAQLQYRDDLRAIVEEVCAVTEMGFAALARVSSDRWIACLVVDRIEFGLDPGDELEIQTTICSEIRSCGEAIVFDSASADMKWRAHHTPALYGFESYASFPVFLDDGDFFGTLCAIDPRPRQIQTEEVVEQMTKLARAAGKIVSKHQARP